MLTRLINAGLCDNSAYTRACIHGVPTTAEKTKGLATTVPESAQRRYLLILADACEIRPLSLFKELQLVLCIFRTI